jgi:hypothetical protein
MSTGVAVSSNVSVVPAREFVTVSPYTKLHNQRRYPTVYESTFNVDCVVLVRLRRRTSPARHGQALGEESRLIQREGDQPAREGDQPVV